MARPEPLVVWLHGRPVATVDRARGDRLRLTYSDVVQQERVPNTPVLSCSLLVGSRPLDATAFVDGLLPEGDHRRHLAERARVAAHDIFGLIAHYGRDIAGAVQFASPDVDPTDRTRWGVEPLSGDRLDSIVAELPTNPLAVVDESELSLAGMQNKMLLVRLPDRSWARPLYGQPSTHILKRDSDRYPGLVAAEAEALAVARHVGLTSTRAWVERHGGYDCVIIERLDRVVDDDGNVVARLHQEDACQALGLPATRKYELHHGGGGPELEQIADLLDRHSADPLAELDWLAALATFTVLIGNADAHGKNVAFLLDDAGTIRLAPAYDTVPTVLRPSLRREMAMTIGGTVTAATIDVEAIRREARRWRHSPASAAAAARTCAELALDALAQDVIDPGGKLARQIRRAARRFTR